MIRFKKYVSGTNPFAFGWRTCNLSVTERYDHVINENPMVPYWVKWNRKHSAKL